MMMLDLFSPCPSHGGVISSAYSPRLYELLSSQWVHILRRVRWLCLVNRSVHVGAKVSVIMRRVVLRGIK